MTGVAEEIAEIEQVLFESPDDYFRDGQMQERYSALLSAQEGGGPAPPGPSANQQRLAELEQMMQMPANESPYWHSEQLRQEYRNLIERGADCEVMADDADGPTTTADVAEAFGISEDMAGDMIERVEAAFGHLDTSDMDLSFEAMCDEGQTAVYALLACPGILSDREATEVFVGQLSDAAWEDLRFFEQSLLPAETAALRHALLLD